MNPETMTEQVVLAQAGDAEALEALLFAVHAPVSFLCRKLLRNEEAAEEETREVLTIAAKKLHTLQEPGLFEKWILRITAARCMQALPQLRWGSQMEETAAPELDIAGRELTPEETADAVLSMLDTLPDDPRSCILLYCCTGMHSRSIAQVAGYTPDSVRTNLARGQELLQAQLETWQQQGTVFTGITSLAEILRAAMYRDEDHDAALPVVYGVLGKEIPVPPDPTRWIVRLLTVIFVLLLVVFLGLCGLLAFRILGSRVEAPIPTTVATVSTTAPTGMTTLPTQTTIPETTMETEPPTVPETTEATEAVETEETVPATQAPASRPSTNQGSANSGNSGTSNPPADAPKTGEDGHSHRYLTTKTNFNCETGGTRRYLCADCDYYYTVDLSPSGTHSFIVVPAGPMGSSPTCTKAGTALKACSNCNYSAMVEDPSQPALGHSYTDTVVAPAPGVQGYTQHTCSRCGDTYSDNYVDALPVVTEPPASDPPASDPPAEPLSEPEI